ncbi:MAG: class I SAM-dependent methyltransferase [Bacteroidales bacterium]|nr:class I SAM-dependent methyltransferase [Bacteroidales bacterium]
MKYIKPFINPLEWIRAIRFHRRNAKIDKSAYDLELWLYSKILKNDMLHFGYFEDTSIQPDTMSFKQLEDAQVKYAKNIIGHIKDIRNPVLDVGCGMGGLAEMMHKRNLWVEMLTPNRDQIVYINKQHPHLKSHCCKFEKFESERKFGTIINSESLQYISLKDAFLKANEIILPGGRWIIVDFFRLKGDSINKTSHLLENFDQAIREFNWTIVYQQDITQNVLPTLAFAYMYVERFLLPLKHVGYEKLRYKKPWLYYLTREIRDYVDNKIIKESAAIDPSKFIQEKKYMFFVLEKTIQNNN